MNTYTQTQITHLCSTTYFDPVLNTRILSFFQVNWTDFPWNSSKFLRFEGCLSNVIIQEGKRNQRAPFDSESDEHFSEGAAAAGDKAAPRGGGGGATPLPAGGGGGGVARRRGGVHGAEHLPHDVHVAVFARPHLIPQLPQACNHAHDTDQSRRRRRRRRRPNQSKKQRRRWTLTSYLPVVRRRPRRAERPSQTRFTGTAARSSRHDMIVGRT